mgnify:FL=1
MLEATSTVLGKACKNILLFTVLVKTKLMSFVVWTTFNEVVVIARLDRVERRL